MRADIHGLWRGSEKKTASSRSDFGRCKGHTHKGHREKVLKVMNLGLGFRGPGRRSLGAKSQKVSKKSRKSLPGPPGPGVPKVRKKSRKRSEKSPKTHFQTFWRLFGPFSRLFPDFWDPGAGRPRETFSRLFGFWPRDSFSQVHGISNLGIFQGVFRVFFPMHFAGMPFRPFQRLVFGARRNLVLKSTAPNTELSEFLAPPTSGGRAQ